MTLTSYFDVALNKHDAGQASVFCVWLFSLQQTNVYGCQKIINHSNAI